MAARPSFISAVVIAAALCPSTAFAGGAAVSGSSGERIDVVHNTIASFSSEGSTVVEQVLWQGDGVGPMLWVLAVPPDAELVFSSDALVSTFDRSLQVVVRQPPNSCFTMRGGECLDGSVGSGGGVGGSTGTELPVAGTVLFPSSLEQADDDAAVATWFAAAGVTPPGELMDSLQAAELAGYGFALMELPAGSGLLTSAVVRITSSEANPEFVPMLAPRPTAEMNLTVIGNRRYRLADQPSATIEEKQLEWDWDALTSNYAPLAGAAIDAGWLAEAGEPLSPYAFDKLFMLAATDAGSSGYQYSDLDPTTAAKADADALRLGLDAGSTWVTRLVTRVPDAGFGSGLALESLDSLSIVDRDLTPASETGNIPSCEDSGDCGFGDEMPGGKEIFDEGCSASGDGATGAWAILAMGLALAARKRRLPIA